MSSDPDMRGKAAGTEATQAGLDHRVDLSRLLVAIGQMGQMVVTDTDSLRQALHAVNENAVRLLGIDRASIWRLEGDGLVKLVDRYGTKRNVGLDAASHIPAREFHLPDTFLSDPVVAFRDLADVPENYRHAAEIMRDYGLTAAIVSRIWVDGRVAGVLVLSRIDGVYDWSELEIVAAEALASLAGRWLEAANRHKVLRELDIQQRRMAGFAAVSSDCYWETDAGHHFSFLSRGAEDAFGVAADRILGQPLVSAVSATGDISSGQRQLSTALALHRPLHDIDLRLGSGPDDERILRLNGRAIWDQDGSFLGYRGTAKDMTASFANERRLRTHLAGLEQLTPINEQGHIDLNRVFRQTVKLAAQSIDGISPSLWLWDERQRLLQCVAFYDTIRDRFIDAGVVQYDRINPIVREPYLHGVTVQDIPDVSVHMPVPPALVELLGSYGVRSVLDALLWRDGGLVAVLGIGHRSVGHPWSATQKLILESLANNVLRSLEAHELQVTRDALRHSEARFRGFAESASDWFWETGRDHRLTYLSEHHETVSGLRNADVLGRTRWNIPQNDADDPVWRRHMATLARRRPFRDFRYSSRAPEGHMRLISISGKPVFSDQGEFIGYRGTGRDVSDDETGSPKGGTGIELYRSALDALPCSVRIFDSNDRLVFRNRISRQRVDDRYGLKTVGMHVEDLVNTLVDFGLVPEARGREEEWVRERLRIHASEEHQFTVHRGRDDEQVLEVYHQRLPDGGALLTTIDMTIYSDSVDDLRTSEARYRDFAAAGSDWIWETDSDHRFTFVSELSVDSTALADVDIVGSTRWDLAGSDGNDFDWRRHRADLAAHRPFRDFRFHHQLADGQSVGIVTSGVPRFDDSGTFLGYRGTGRIAREVPGSADSSLQVGDMLNRILDQLPAGIAVYAVDGEIVHCNPRFNHFCRELLDLDPTHASYSAMAECILERISPNPRLGVGPEQIRERLQRQREQRHGYVSLYFASAAIRHVDLVTFPAPAGHFMVCLNDSTVEAEQAWEAEQGLRLRALSDPLARIAATLSTALSAGEHGQPSSEAVVAVAQHIAQRLALLDRVQKPQPRRLDLSAWLTNVTSRKPSGIPEALHLEVMDDTRPLYCSFDPELLTIALSEVLRNSAEACGPSATVTLRLLEAAPGVVARQCARLCIMDSGPGIPGDLVSRACEPFVSGHDDRAARGLGLTIAACCVQGVGGYLFVRNRSDGGTTVELGLPTMPEADGPGE